MNSSSKRNMPPPRNVPPPAGAKPAAAYARFIPREEISSFAAWNPEALCGGPPANSPLRRTTDRQAAAGAPVPAEDLAAQLRASRQSGYQDGYRDGLVGLEEFRHSYARQVALQLDTLTAAYQRELDALQQQLAQAVAGAAEQVARQVVRSELASRPDFIAMLAQEAIDTLLMSARNITLRVHPDDHALVAPAVGDALGARGARLVCDPALTRGGCAVEADIGAIDATLETRWERAAASLGRESSWSAAEPPHALSPARDAE